MSRTEYTYRAGDVEARLILPDELQPPTSFVAVRHADGARGTFSLASARAVRAPAKRKPRQASPLAKITADWAPPADEIERARAAAPSVGIEYETAQFVDWALSKGEARADWPAAWRRWIRRTHKANVEKGWKPTVRRDEDPRARWCREHGVTVEQYEARKGDAEWLSLIERRGVVA
ncbi:hypothetical protein J2Y69_002492 [Microbacterium resistens]|uniref:Lsr2 protein n=1 Tax=Microbacterium resistens TaxID=156977 RepID=A0ABU1SE53_9MICO|nr:hypothetical protein [Microbacterium resistens]MDR6867884.1 hypothetical protein [Microbacterium resistens]